MMKKKEIKLHLGCGPKIQEGWVNIDNNYDNNIDLKKLDINMDLTEPLPFSDNYADKVFHEHFIEHLVKPEGEKFLKECYRVLKKGGVMRIGWPDIQKLMVAYVKRDRKYYDYIAPNAFWTKKDDSWDELIPDFFYSWDHRYGYTRKHMERVLKSIGFREIRKKNFNSSDYGFDIDSRDDPATTYLEAVK